MIIKMVKKKEDERERKGAEMGYKVAVSLKDVKKKFKNFSLEIDRLEIPEGFATALIGENGAGKSTLMNILGGVRRDYKGEVVYFEEKKKQEKVIQEIGFTSPNGYFLPRWTIENVGEVSEILFPGFQKEAYEKMCCSLGLWESRRKRIEKLSDGMRMKTALAAVWARETRMLIMDEPASSLDPVMRDRLCDMIREYLAEGNSERSVLYSTHNIADMENVTDYCILMDKGSILEAGFVEELKEKYLLIKAEAEEEERVLPFLIGARKSDYGLEGICKTEDLDRLAGTDITAERPTLSQICISLMKHT